MFVGLYNDFDPLATAQTVYCKDDTRRTLTQVSLRNMIDTVAYEVFKSGYGSTILTSDNFLTTYKSGTAGHSEAQFIESNSASLGNFPNLWINNSPCTACAKKLIDAYAGVTPKPTIHAAHFYRGKDSNKKPIDREIVLQCLAKMVASGIKLEAFDWKEYQKLVSNLECKNDIQEALGNSKFNEKMKEMENIVKTVNNYATTGKTRCS